MAVPMSGARERFAPVLLREQLFSISVPQPRVDLLLDLVASPLGLVGSSVGEVQCELFDLIHLGSGDLEVLEVTVGDHDCPSISSRSYN